MTRDDDHHGIPGEPMGPDGLRFNKTLVVEGCPRCGHDDIGAGEREGTPLIGCQACGWPDAGYRQ